MGEMTFDTLQAQWKADQNAAIAEAIGKLAPSPAPAPAPAPGEPAPGKASMGAVGIGGIVESLDGFKIPVLNVSVPIASVIVGGSTGLLYGNLVDKFSPPQNPDGKINLINPALQVVGMGAALMVGPRLMGRTASMFAAGSIVTRLAFRYTPLGGWLQNLEDVLSKPFNPSGVPSPRTNTVLDQANKIVRTSDAPYSGTGL